MIACISDEAVRSTHFLRQDTGFSKDTGIKESEQMTIKKKIRLSNIMMVLIPILFTAIVINVCLHTSLWQLLVYTGKAMYSDENSIQFAQSMIYTYQQELWENNWGQGE
mgnify:CR=1 FL=1